MPSSTSKQARYWLGTVNPDHGVWEPPTVLPDNVVWLRGQRELASTGTQHWQLFAAFDKKVRLSTVKTSICNGHWEPSRSEAAEQYVWKEDTAIANTRFELGAKKLNRNSREFWSEQFELAKRGDLKNIEPDVAIKYYSTLKKIAFDYSKPPEPLNAVCGIWIWGPPGVGKSHSAREWYGNVFNKNLNKWWDGYKGEDAVLLDDVSVDHKNWIGYFLKIWADKYPFQAEVKGGTLNIRPKKLIVTSNYPIDHLWGDQFALLEAIQRRFYVIKIEKPLY